MIWITILLFLVGMLSLMKIFLSSPLPPSLIILPLSLSLYLYLIFQQHQPIFILILFVSTLIHHQYYHPASLSSNSPPYTPSPQLSQPAHPIIWRSERSNQRPQYLKDYQCVVVTLPRSTSSFSSTPARVPLCRLLMFYHTNIFIQHISILQPPFQPL